MMTTRIASKRKHRKPRLKHWSMKAETLGDLLFESFIFQVPVVHIHATHWEKFTKNPCWWKRFCICSFEVFYKVFSRTFILLRQHCHTIDENGLITKKCRIGKPIYITSPFSRHIHYGFSYSNFDFFYLIKKKQSQFFVKAIKHHHFVKCSTFLIQMKNLWSLQQRMHIRRQSIIANALQIQLSLLPIINYQSTIFQ
mgnify:CR=1 FL=1